MVTTTNEPRTNHGRAVYTLAETAELFGISRSALYIQCREKRAPVEPVRIARKLMFPKSRVNALLAIDDAADPVAER